MKKILIRLQLVFVSIVVFMTLALTQVIVQRNNQRWDFTQEKIFTLAEETQTLLTEMRESSIKLLVFYPQDEDSRKEIEIYLKQMQLSHPDLKYDFHDPDRVPRLAKQYHIKDLYTIVILYQNRYPRYEPSILQSIPDSCLTNRAPASGPLWPRTKGIPVGRLGR